MITIMQSLYLYYTTFSNFIMFASIVGTFTLGCYFIHILQMFWQMFVLSCKSFFKYDSRLLEKYGDWAVITGSTDGIGKRYTMELAKRGINVVLISRNSDKLKKVAQEIELKYKVRTKIIAADFSKGTQVYPHIEEELRKIPVGILVNNVGVLEDHPMRVCDVPMEKIWEMINVNVMTVASMTRMVVPAMIERGRGAVVNVSSASAWQPVPLMGVYSSTKAFVNVFTAALQEEYSHTNIDFSCIYPMFISSNMTSFSENLSKGSIFTPDTVSFAKQAVNALGMFSMTAGYGSHIIQVELLRMLPTWARTKISAFVMEKLKTEYEQSLKFKRK